MAKRNLKHAKHRLVSAENQLQKAQEELALKKKQLAQKPVEVTKQSDDLQDEETMRQFFMKSKVYQQFEEEQRQELAEDQECQETKQELHDLKQKFITLSQEYDQLEQKALKQKMKEQAFKNSNKKKQSLMQVRDVPTIDEAEHNAHMNDQSLVPPPLDQQYEVPAQMRQPLIYENRDETHDAKHYYNPAKRPTPQNYLTEKSIVQEQLKNATTLAQ